MLSNLFCIHKSTPVLKTVLKIGMKLKHTMCAPQFLQLQNGAIIELHLRVLGALGRSFT